MKNRNKFNVILDMIIFIVMLAVYCIKGQYHEPLAYTIGSLTTLHIALHWRQFCSMVKNNLGNRNVILDLVMFLVMLSLFFIEHGPHEIIAYALGLLVILHFIWHWKQFKAMYCQLIPKTAYRYLVGAFAGILLAAVLAAPLYLTINEQAGHGHGYGSPPERAYGEKGRH